MQPQKPNQPQPVRKHGMWVERPRVSTITVCECGNKYISARKDQSSCVQCISKKSRLVK